MNEIDDMDMLGFLRIRAWNARRKQPPVLSGEKKHIDEVWPGLRPGR